MSNPAYGTMPMFEPPRNMATGGGGGGFIPPPPGASQGGEPGHYDPFPGYGRAANSSTSHNWPSLNNPSQAHYPPWYSQQSAPPVTHGQNAWTYGQYPPTPPATTPTAPTPGASFTPITPTGHNHWSPYLNPHQHPFASAPAHYTPWSQQPHVQAHNPYPDDQPITLGPFNRSANAGMPKKSAMKRTSSQKARKRSPEFETATMQRSTSTGSGFGHGSGFGYGSGFGQGSGHGHGSGFGQGSGHGHDSGFGHGSHGWPTPSSAPAVPSYAQGDSYDERNLARRPRDWRSDYSPKQGFSSYLPKVGKNRSDVAEYVDPVKRTMHPLLIYTANAPPIALNLRLNPLDAGNLGFPNLTRPHNEIDFAQLATSPHSQMLRLYHPRLPWYIDVHQSHPNGVTVFDVIVQLSRQMLTPILGRHYYNEVLDDADRGVLARTFSERVKDKPEDVNKGVMQVDFLGEKCVLEGFVRGKQGMWEIRTRRPGL